MILNPPIGVAQGPEFRWMDQSTKRVNDLLVATELIPQNSFLGRISAATGRPEQITLAQLAALVTVTGAVPTTRMLTAGTGLTGGGDLSADRTFAVTGNLTTLYALANSPGWLHNDGAGVLAWSTPPDTGLTQLTGDVTAGPGSGAQAATASAAIARRADILYVGTTAIALNRASAPQALTGITSIDGNAATATSLSGAIANNTILGNQSGGSATPSALALLTDFPLTKPKITTGLKDANGAMILAFGATPAAVNYLTVNNSATGDAISLNATGPDADIGINYITKGTGPHVFTGNIGIGAAPTARLHLPAGSATANTAPLKFTSGTSLTTAEAGTVEFDGTNFYLTI